MGTESRVEILLVRTWLGARFYIVLWMDFLQYICVIGLFILNKAINIGINFNLQYIYSYSPYELNSHAHLISWVMPIKWNTMYITQTINRNQSVDKYLIYMFFMRQKGVLLIHNYSCHLPLPKLNHCKKRVHGTEFEFLLSFNSCWVFYMHFMIM